MTPLRDRVWRLLPNETLETVDRVIATVLNAADCLVQVRHHVSYLDVTQRVPEYVEHVHAMMLRDFWDKCQAEGAVPLFHPVIQEQHFPSVWNPDGEEIAYLIDEPCRRLRERE